MAVPIEAITAALGLIEKVSGEIIKSDSEKLRDKWEKDKARLAEAIRDGDLDTISRISAEWADGL